MRGMRSCPSGSVAAWRDKHGRCTTLYVWSENVRRRVTGNRRAEEHPRSLASSRIAQESGVPLHLALVELHDVGLCSTCGSVHPFRLQALLHEQSAVGANPMRKLVEQHQVEPTNAGWRKRLAQLRDTTRAHATIVQSCYAAPLLVEHQPKSEAMAEEAGAVADAYAVERSYVRAAAWPLLRDGAIARE